MWRTFDEFKDYIKIMMYADDHVILLKQQEKKRTEHIMNKLREHMALDGLSLNEKKSNIMSLLGQHQNIFDRFLTENANYVVKRFRYLGTEVKSDQNNMVDQIMM